MKRGGKSQRKGKKEREKRNRITKGDKTLLQITDFTFRSLHNDNISY